MKPLRIRCQILGCHWTPDAICGRCGEDYYGEFPIHRGIWERAVYPVRRFKQAVWPKCNQCGRLLLFRERHYGGDFCSEACFQEWLPF